jgi:hypothetical protein
MCLAIHVLRTRVFSCLFKADRRFLDERICGRKWAGSVICSSRARYGALHTKSAAGGLILSGRFCAFVISKSSLLYRSKRPSFLICPSILHRRGAGPWLSPALSLFTSALPCPAFSDQFAVELVNIFPAECGGWTTSWPKACAQRSDQAKPPSKYGTRPGWADFERLPSLLRSDGTDTLVHDIGRHAP